MSQVDSRPGRQPDLAGLLSGMRNPDKLADHPLTIACLEAGERLLHSDFARDAGQLPPAKGSRPPFEELLAWLSRRRILAEAERVQQKSRKKNTDAVPTESAFRHRWGTQVDYLRDLVVFTLMPRLHGPDQAQIDGARCIVEKFRDEGRPLHEAIDEIAFSVVTALMQDKTFRLQLVFQATLAHDDIVKNMLHRVDQAKIRAWTDFYCWALTELGLGSDRWRPGTDIKHLAKALHATAEGVVVRALICPALHSQIAAQVLAEDPQKSSLAVVVKALLVAFVDDAGDGMALNQSVDRLSRQLKQDA